MGATSIVTSGGHNGRYVHCDFRWSQWTHPYYIVTGPTFYWTRATNPQGIDSPKKNPIKVRNPVFYGSGEKQIGNQE